MSDIAALGFDIDTQNLSRANRELNNLTQSAQRAEQAAGRLTSAFSGIHSAAQVVQAANTQISQSATAAVTATNSAASAAATGAQNAARASSRAATSIANDNVRIVDSINKVGATYRYLVALIGAGVIGKAMDEYIGLNNVMKLTGLAGDELTDVQNRLFESANKHGVSIDALGNLYRRLSIASKDLGATQKTMLDVVDGVAASIRVQGSGTEKARGALLQLSQSFSTGVVHAEEWNSIVEGAYPVAMAAAMGIDRFKGSVAALQVAVKSQQITSKEFFEGLVKGLPKIQEMADGMQITLGGALTVVNNGIVRFMGGLDAATGVSKAVTDVIMDLGKAIDNAGVWLDKNKNLVPEFAENLTAVATVITTLLIPAFVELGIAGAAAMTRITLAMMRNPFGALAVALTVVLTTMYQFRDEISGILGTDIMELAKDAGNFLIRAFVSAYETVKYVWNNFTDVITSVIQGAVTSVISGLNSLLNMVIPKLNELISMANKIPGVNLGRIGKDPIGQPEWNRKPEDVDQRLGMAADKLQVKLEEIASKDYIGAIGNAFRRATEEAKKFDTGAGGALGQLNKKAQSAWLKALEYGKEFVMTQEAAYKAIGLPAREAEVYKYEQELLNKAQSEGIVVSKEQAAILHKLAEAMAKVKSRTDAAKFVFETSRDADAFVEQQKIEREALTMTAEAAAKYRKESELLAAAKKNGMILTPEQVDVIKNAAGRIAEAETQTKNLSDAMQFAKQVASGFFSDMKNSLMQGKGMWESFGSAALNVLNRIADKLINLVVDDAFNMLMNPGGAGTTGSNANFSGTKNFLGGVGNLLSGGSGSAGSLSGMWDTTSNWFSGLMGNKPTDVGQLMDMQGLGGSGLGLGNYLGAAGGLASGVMQLAKGKGSTGSMIGGIGSMIGAGVSLIPGIGQIAGPAISILSSIAGGLLGGGESQAPPAMRANASMNWTGSDFGVSGGAYNGAEPINGQLAGGGSGIKSLFDMLGGVIDATKVWGMQMETFSQGNFSNATTFLTDPTGNKRQWGQGSNAHDIGLETAMGQVALQSMLGGAVKLSPDMKSALNALGPNTSVTLETLQNVIQAVKGIETAMKDFGRDVPDAEKALRQINDQFDELNKVANQYGITQASISAIQTERLRQQKKLTDDFTNGIQQGLLGFTDPLQASLNDLEKSKQKDLETNKVFVDQVAGYADQASAIEELYLKRRNQMIDQYNQQALSSLDALIKSYMPGGSLSGMNQTAQLAGLQSNYNAALAQAQKTPLDQDVIQKFAQANSELGTFAKGYYGNDTRYIDMRDKLLSDAQTIESMIKKPGGSTSGDPTTTVDPNTQLLMDTITTQSAQISELMTQLARLTAKLERYVVNNG